MTMMTKDSDLTLSARLTPIQDGFLLSCLELSASILNTSNAFLVSTNRNAIRLESTDDAVNRFQSIVPPLLSHLTSTKIEQFDLEQNELPAVWGEFFRRFPNSKSALVIPVRRHDSNFVGILLVRSVAHNLDNATLDRLRSLSNVIGLRLEFQKNALNPYSHDRLAATIAHEVGNHLSILGARSHLIMGQLSQENPDLPRITNIAKGLNQNILNLIHLVRSIKLLGASNRVDQTEVELKSIFKNVFELCAERLDQSRIEFRFDPAIEIRMSCHSILISQILVNLVFNAIDAIKSNSERWITLTAKSVDNFTEIRCTDSGNGIRREMQDKLFMERFTTKAGQGMGLGLSLSKAYAQINGGDLSIDSESKNTCFVLRVPHKSK